MRLVCWKLHLQICRRLPKRKWNLERKHMSMYALLSRAPCVIKVLTLRPLLDVNTVTPANGNTNGGALITSQVVGATLNPTTNYWCKFGTLPLIPAALSGGVVCSSPDTTSMLPASGSMSLSVSIYEGPLAATAKELTPKHAQFVSYGMAHKNSFWL